MDDLLDTLPVGIVSFGDDGIVTAVNRTLAELVGYSSKEIEGHHFERLLTIAGRIFFQTHFFPLLKLHGIAEEIFLLLRCRDGEDAGMLVNAVRRERGGVFVNDCAMIQVRERRKYEDELLKARRDADAARAEVVARNVSIEDANTLLRDQALELEQQQQQLQDQAMELEAQRDELRNANEELRERSSELESARYAAEEANQAKSQFLTTMSHELRTPLNAIGGYVQLIELGIHGPVTAAQREALDRIDRSQRHLLRLINEILNIARIESGRVDYTIQDLAISEVIGSVLPMVEPQMNEAGLTLESRVSSDAAARADRDKVAQILINLLNNAIKFTPHGGRVSITVGRAESDGQVQVRVSDTGVGIPASKLDSIFEPFVQVVVDRADRREGTGLGLAISRDLARAMDGDLVAESEMGVGSTFTLSLPGAG